MRKLLGAILVALTLTFSASAVAAAPPAPAPTQQGFYASGQDPSAVSAVASSLNTPAQIVSGYTQPNVSNYTPYWGASNPEDYRLSLAVSMTDGGTLKTVRSHLADYTTLGNSLVTDGADDAILRIGWEINGNYGGGGYPWVTNNPALFKRDFRLIVRTLRAVPGQHFLFVFNVNDAFTYAWPNGMTGDAGFKAYYPGNKYVSIIGDDAYDNGYPSGNTGNIIPLVQEAVAHGKPWSLDEWGLDGTDDPTYINQVAALVLGQDGYPAAYVESYFDYAGSTLGSSVPNATAAFSADFGQ